jgi:NADH-quinone oxidoreductase subunit G
VIAVASFASDSLRAAADVILPLAPHAEGEGSLVDYDGDSHAFRGGRQGQWRSAQRLENPAQAGRRTGPRRLRPGRPGGSPGRPAARRGSRAPRSRARRTLREPAAEQGLYRIGEVAMYSVDPLCRRAAPLQQTAQAQSRFVALNPADAGRLGLAGGAVARVRQGGGSAEARAELEVVVSDDVPAGGAWLRSATCDTRLLGAAIAPIVVEPAAAEVA